MSRAVALRSRIRIATSDSAIRWVDRLPEAGGAIRSCIERDAEVAETQAAAEAEVARLVARRAEIAEDAARLARREWTEEEIEAAGRRAAVWVGP